jgi:arylsulfatase A-like enzyme
MVFSCTAEKAINDHIKPNILFIYSDDHTYQAVSAYKSFLSETIETPNLDRLAKEGMRFENAFCTNSICTPARATVLTGKYSHNNGIKTLDRAFDGSQQTFPKLLQRAGYYTGIIGKWHLKSQPTGFDYYNVLPGQGAYFNPVMSESTMPWFVVPGGDPNVPFWEIEEGKPGGFNSAGIQKHEGYVTDIITDKTLDFLKNRPKDKPFLLMYQHKAPHDMFKYDKKHAHIYSKKDIPEPFNLLDDYKNRGQAIKRTTQKIYMNSEDKIEDSTELLIDGRNINETRVMGDFTSLQQLYEFLHKNNTDEFDEIMSKIETLSPEQKTKIAYQMYIKAYLRCVVSIDDNVGLVLKFLDDEGLTDNTIVIYTSDQGFFLGEHGLFDKRFMYDESLRIPLLIRYPKEIKPGSVSKNFVVNIDFAPTFLDYAGLKIPNDMDGESLRPVLRGKTPENWRTDMYYRYWMHRAHYNIAAHYGIRTDRYKLIFYYGLPLDASGAFHESTPPEWELFDLQKDPSEMNNVYNDPTYADEIKQLKTRLLELKKQYKDTDNKYPELTAVRKQYWD